MSLLSSEANVPPTSQSESLALTVTELNAMVAEVLESHLTGYLWVSGEISNYTCATSGHRYFSLKDSRATVSCALFKGQANRITPSILTNLRSGDKVTVKAALSVYQPRGQYQLIIHDIEPAGFGDLARAFAILKAKLDKEGLTAQDRKKTLPSWPAYINIVTSQTGAAIRDVLKTLERRAPFIPVYVYPTLVQGDKAPQAIVEALSRADTKDQSDGSGVILLVRGGGSLEDLQAFNDERVARAIVDCHLPVITGVGHETDFTIADFVSDYRAPTPTAAAEITSPDKLALSNALNKYQKRLLEVIGKAQAVRLERVSAYSQRLTRFHPFKRLQMHQQRLDEFSHRLFRQQTRAWQGRTSQLSHLEKRLAAQSPKRRMLALEQQLRQLETRLFRQEKVLMQPRQRQLADYAQRLQQMPRRLMQAKTQLAELEHRLQLLSPNGLLARGYLLAFDEQHQLAKRRDALGVGDRLTLRFVDGDVSVVVDKIDKAD